MRMQYLDGDRTAALAQYERCVTALRDELGVAPAQRTTVLYEQICADRLEPEPRAVVPTPSTTPAPPTDQELEQLRALLLEMRRQADEGIEAVTTALRHRTSSDS
jgi:DNA-binding SARP family transcriptional activator